MKYIIMGILSLIVLTMIFFSFIKANDAERTKMEALEQLHRAQENKRAVEVQLESAAKRALEAEREAQKVIELAAAEAADARREKERADMIAEELAKCQGK